MADRATIGARPGIATTARIFVLRPTDTLDFAAVVTGPSLPVAAFQPVAETVTWAGVPWFVECDGSRGGTTGAPRAPSP